MDVVVAAFQGDYGKPRPALVVQSDLLNSTHASILLCHFTTHDEGAAERFRLPIEPGASGLGARSWLMVDKITVLRRDKVGSVIGRLDRDASGQVDATLALVLGLA